MRFPVILCEYARGLANSTALLLDKYDVKPTPGVAAIRRAYVYDSGPIQPARDEEKNNVSDMYVLGSFCGIAGGGRYSAHSLAG